MRILVGIDGSAPSLMGAFFAAQLARAIGAAIDLVHVGASRTTSRPADDRLGVLSPADDTHANDVLHRAELSIADQGVPCLKTKVTGSPAEALADLAQMEGVWGVVVGARGHNPVSRVLLGSVADRLVHICEKPVVIVR